MPALLGLLAFDEIWDISVMVRYGLLSLKHRGSGLYVACGWKGSRISCRESESIGGAVERGWNAAVAAAYSTSRSSSRVARAERGGLEVAVVSSRDYKSLEDVASSIASSLSTLDSRTLDALRESLSSYENLPSILAITSRGEIVAFRDSLGLEPLALGGYGFDLAIAASESSAIEILDGEVRKSMEPGELALLSKKLVKSARVGVNEARGLCLFELLYLARHDSTIDGISVYEFRKTLGARLASRMRDSDRVDVVVGVPESATPYAIGLAGALGKPYELAFVPTVRERSMLKISPLHKLIAIHLKMNPVRRVLEGKRIAIVDDSMVTGATAKTVSQLLRLRVGAEEVHFLVASPPIVDECPFSLMRFDKESLVAANLTDSDIESYLEVDSLTWLSLNDVLAEAESRRLSVCASCFGRRTCGVKRE